MYISVPVPDVLDVLGHCLGFCDVFYASHTAS